MLTEHFIDIENKETSDSITDNEIYSIFKSKIEENYPMTTEPESNVQRRADATKLVVSKYLSDTKFNAVDANSSVEAPKPLPKVVLVAHNGFLCHYKGIKTHAGIKDVSVIPNCQFLPDATDYSNLRSLSE